MGKIVEGVWDCTHCNSKNIKARYKNCPNCGASQDEDTVFRLPDQITYVPENEAKHISRQPDWQCSYCNQLNKDTDTTCEGCGASKQDSEYNYFQLQEKKSTKIEQIEVKSNDISQTSKSYGSNKKFDWKPLIYILGGVLGIAALITLIVFLVTPKTKIVTVDEISWKYCIDIEEHKTVNESGWSLPSNARLKRTNQEIQRYEQIIDHYETVTKTKSRQVIDHYETVVTGYKDLGNGYFEEQTAQRPVYKTEYYTVTEKEPVYKSVPIYATKYYYEIDKWIVIDNITTSGTDKEPYYGEKQLTDKQRYGTKSQTFIMKCTDEDGQTDTYNINQDDWKSINKHDKLKIEVNMFNNISSIEHLTN